MRICLYYDLRFFFSRAEMTIACRRNTNKFLSREDIGQALLVISRASERKCRRPRNTPTAAPPMAQIHYIRQMP